MDCQACGASIGPGMRFCPACGARVAQVCTGCGAELPADARFCSSCGTATAGPGVPTVAPEAATGGTRERKISTVVFADLVGFTRLNESQDPEQVGALISRAFDRLSAEVARYQGLLEKFAGDALLAIFGVPAVHEDDAERAVRAALEMQSAMAELATELRAEGRPELALRIGIETGEVLVDLQRAADERDRIVIGDAVNTAARLQQHASPGAILVGPVTYAATRHVVEYEEQPPSDLKGKALPVATWRAVSVKARRGGQRPSLGIEAPLIGREEEISLIKDTVRRTVADRRPHLVTVIGSAGVGKSRLTWELEKYLDGLPDVYYWRKGRCLAYAQASFSALADALKVDARILDDDAPTTAVAKLQARLEELQAGDEPNLLASLRILLAVGSTADLGRDELFDAWRRYLELLAREEPLVLVQEDIHWADDGLLDFIEYLARWGEGPIVILCLARHELLERRPAWGGGMPNAASIVLEPLNAAESTQLVDALLAGGLPPELRDRVVALADGNPLFTEELVRMFVDRGVLRFVDGRWELARPVDEVEIPGSIQAVLAARLDGLPAGEKLAAQNAAVVGRIFWDALIAHLSRQGAAATGELLRRLRVKELVVARQPSALAGAAEFGFRHVLIRDVAYDSLPKRDRAAKHLDVARWAEDALADRQDELVELLAAHYLAALRYEEEFAEAGSERLTDLRRKTLLYARRAAHRADAVFNKQNAARWFRVAAELARLLELPARERATLVMEYETAVTGYGPLETLRGLVEEALALMEATPERTPDDDQLIARLQAELVFYLYTAHEIEAARRLAREGIDALSAGPPTRGRARLHARLGWTFWRGGPVEEAPAILRLAMAEARACGAVDIERLALHELAVATGMLGDIAASQELVERSMALARDAGDRVLLGRCYINVPAIMSGNGEVIGRMNPIIDEGLERARRSMDHVSASWIAQNAADYLAFAGRLRAALGYAEEAIANARAIGVPARLASCLVARANVRLLLGDRTGAREDLDEARRTSENDEPQSAIYDVMFDALLLWPDDASGATRIFSTALRSPDIAQASLIDTAPTAVRMALRTGDRDLLAADIRAFTAVADRATGPVRRLQRRWFEPLLDDGEGAVDEVRQVAVEFEALGYPLPAADALADAVLLAARLGRDPADDRRRAAELYASCEAVPLLDPWPLTDAAGVSGRSARAPA